MADVVAEGRGVSGVVLVGVEAAQNVGAEVVVPKHFGDGPATGILPRAIKGPLVLLALHLHECQPFITVCNCHNPQWATHGIMVNLVSLPTPSCT